MCTEVCESEKETSWQTATLERLAALEISLQERELERAYRIARLGTWRWVCATDESTWSPEVYKAFGLDPDGPAPGFEMIRSLHSEESRTRLEAMVERALTTGQGYVCDIELVLPSGEHRWVLATGEVEAYEGDQAAVLRGTVQDITQRKLGELAMAERALELRESQRIGRTGSWRVILATGLVSWSDEVYRLIERDPELGVAALSAEMFDGDSYERLMKAVDEAVHEGRARSLKCAEAALRERELRFQALAESLPALIWISNPQGARVYTNQRYQDYTGIPADALLGEAWIELVHPDDRPRTQKLWNRCMLTGELYENQYRIRHREGGYRSFLVRAVAIRDDEGAIQRWVGSATDIHDQKLAEEVVRRTEKLATAGRLAASIAHEINNPLAVVTNSVYLALMDEGLSPATRQYLTMAEQELARAAHVTAQTLQFQRQDSVLSSVQLAEVMESAFTLFAARFRASSVRVNCEYDGKRALLCSHDEMRQVFANLLSNALDAMRQGGVLRLRIREAHRWDETAEAGLRVTIADTGSGIPPAVMARLFEPFLSTKEVTGTGLGLWVARGIVRKHKGTITVRSAVTGASQGTVFRLFFPFDGITEGPGGLVA